MAIDISTTHYALNHNLGYEGNSLMVGVVSNPILFILIKLIGSMVIIFMIHKIIEKNKTWAYRGMRLIIFMMLFVVANNFMVISANALVFSNFSFGGVAGSVNTGNGYFDNDGDAYGYTDIRNIYVVAEPSQIWFFEPACLSSGCTNFDAFQAVNSSTGLLYDAVVYRGYLYFVDGTDLKKKKTRAITNVVESTDSTAGGTVTIISTGVGQSLRVYNDVLYFTKGTTGIYHLDSDDNEQFDFTMSKASPNAQIRGFTPFLNNSVLTIYTTVNDAAKSRVGQCTSSSCNVIYSGSLPVGLVPTADTYYSTTSKIYINAILIIKSNKLSFNIFILRLRILVLILL